MIGRFKSTYEDRGIHVMFGKARGLGWYMYIFFTTAEIGDAVYADGSRYVGEIESVNKDGTWKVRWGKDVCVLSEEDGYAVDGGDPYYERIQMYDGTDKYKVLKALIAYNAPRWAIEKVKETNG